MNVADGNQVPDTPVAFNVTDVLERMNPGGGAADPAPEAGQVGGQEGAAAAPDQQNQNPSSAPDGQASDGNGKPAEAGAPDPGQEGAPDSHAASSEGTPAEGEGGGASEGGEEGDIVTSFAQLIEHQEWDPDWADNLTLETIVDGETRQVTIGELKATHQTLEAATKRLDDAKAKSHEIHEGLATERKKLAAELAGLQALSNVYDELFGIKDLESELATLKSDPSKRTEYLSLKDELGEKKNALNQIRKLTGNALQEVMAELQSPGMSEEELTELRSKEAGALLEKIPEWQGDSEETVKLRDQERADLVNNAIKAYGFSEDEIKGVLDHRMFLMARDAMLYRKQQGVAEAARGRVLRIPTKHMPAGGDASTDQPKRENRTQSQILYPNK